jgi:hypothetical protein
MKTFVIKSIGTASFVIAMSLPNAAYACCDSFWSCAGAVASAGLSCVLEEIHRQADKLISSARNAIGLARKGYDDVNNDINNRINDAKNQANEAGGGAIAALDASYNNIQSTLNRPAIVLNQAANNATQAIRNVTPGGGNAGLAGGTSGTGSTGSAPSTNGNTGSSKSPNNPPLTMRPGITGDVAGAKAGTAGSGNISVANMMPPDEQEVRRSLQQAQQFVDTLRTQARNTHVPKANNIISQLDGVLINELRNIANQVHSKVIGPLDDFIAKLAKYDPTGFASLIAAAISSIDSIVNLLQNEIFNSLSAVDNLVGSKIDELADPVNHLLASANLAQEIDKAAKALASTPTKAELKKLQSLLPPQPRSSFALAELSSMHMTANVGAARSFRAKKALHVAKSSIAAMQLPLANLSAELKSPLLQTKLTSNPSAQFNLQQFSSKTDQLLAQEFAGLSPAQKASKQQQMLSEARVKFGKDARALQEVERLINQGANVALRSTVTQSAVSSMASPINAVSAPMIRPNNNILQPVISR